MQCSFVSNIIGVISNWNTYSNWNAFLRSVSVPVRGGGLYTVYIYFISLQIDQVLCMNLVSKIETFPTLTFRINNRNINYGRTML